jgi:hypothetical protein
VCDSDSNPYPILQLVVVYKKKIKTTNSNKN